MKLITNVPILIAIIIVFVVSIWFKDRTIIASGEEALVFGYPERTYQIYRSVWYETGTGLPLPIMITRASFFKVAAIVASISTPYIGQAALWSIHIFSGMIAIYYLGLHFGLKKRLALLSALFYFFNLYTMTQVFGRLLTNGVSVWAFLPILTLFWIRWIDNGKIRDVFSFIALSLIFSNAYGHPGYFLTLWLPAFIYTFVVFITVSSKLLVFQRAIILFLIWLVSSLWWLIPYLKIGLNQLTQDPNTNIDSLRGVSVGFPLSQIFTLKHQFIFGPSVFKGNYTSFILSLFAYLIPLLVLLGLNLIKRNRKLLFFAIVLVVGLFLSKGTNPPLGNIFYSWLFAAIPQTQAMRNSYEKCGLLVVFAYSFFFAGGIELITSKIKSIPIRSAVLTVILFATLGYLVYPIWTGELFGSQVQNTHITIPKYYKNADAFLNKLNDDRRLLVTPLFLGDGAKYNWQPGEYSGVDPSEFLFQKPSVSKILRTKYFDPKYEKLYNALQSQNNYYDLMNDFHIGYILINHDNHTVRDMAPFITPIENIVRTDKNIKALTKFGNLDLYEWTPTRSQKLFTTQGTSLPELSYTKISTTHYKIEIKNATKPYHLIFKETFHPLWKASINNTQLKKHIIVSEYANGWELNKIGNYTINLEFKI